MGSSSQSRASLFDPARKIWVKATPEECIRQRWIQHLTSSLGFPLELICVEKKLSELPHLQEKKAPDRRLDILVYSKHPSESLLPLLLIECKVDALQQRQLHQLIGYNDYVGAPFIAVVNERDVMFGYRRQEGEYAFLSFLPTFSELAQWTV